MSATAHLTPESVPLLDAIIHTLVRCDDLRIEIAGHTDNVGSDEENLILSREQAETVADYFVKRGVSRSAMVIAGFGEARPRFDNTTESGRQQNRRIEIIVSPVGSVR